MLPTRLIAGAVSGIVLSAVFATALTCIKFGETFIEPLRVDPKSPAPITLRLPRLTLLTTDFNANHKGLIALSKVIPRGQTVDDEDLSTLVRVYEHDRRPPQLEELGAEWFICFLLSLVITASLRHSSSKLGALLRTQVGLLGLAFVFLLGAKFFLLLTNLPVFLIPVAVIPIWVSSYLNQRTGLEMGVALSLLFSSLISYDPLCIAIFLSSSATAALSLRGSKSSFLFLVSGIAAGCVAIISFTAAKEVINDFSFEHEISSIQSIWKSEIVASGLGGVLAGVIAFIFKWPIGQMLGVMSRGQLLDLTNLDYPLLKKMASEAPGSWEHSRATANIAEAAAAAIGADSMLTRVGAYYHDIGKTCQPKYYVENLDPGEKSPHDSLAPQVSADAIMAHVVEGTRILREAGIPEPIIEFVYSHHGTSTLEYFWHKYKEQDDSDQLTEEAFRYPGIRPRTKETAILMLVDAIEAAARTIDPPNRERFAELVQRVIFVKLNQEQLDRSGLNIEDIKTLSLQITDTLCRVYHSRIRYPWQKDKQKEGEEPSTSSAEKDKTSKKQNDQGTGKHKVVRSKELPSENEKQPTAKPSQETKQKLANEG